MADPEKSLWERNRQALKDFLNYQKEKEKKEVRKAMKYFDDEEPIEEITDEMF